MEEIQGDAYELFERTAKHHPRIARVQFAWNVIRFFRLNNIRNTTSRYRNNSLTMFYNYRLIGFRNAVRNGLTSIINVGGLALGVVSAITIASTVLTGLLVSYLFFMPGLVAIIGYPIPFAFSSGKMLLAFFTGLLIFIVVISGVYPAVFVSGFQPVQILKGKEKFGQRSAFSRILLTLQFMLAFMTIVGCFLFIDNSLYLGRKDWGYDHHQNIVVPLNSHDQYLSGLRLP